MPINATMARKLCSAEEFKVYQAAARGLLDKHSASELNGLVARARKLRDKWRGLLKRQRAEVRGKRAPRGASAAYTSRNTERKLALFEDTLRRLQSGLAARTAPRRAVSRGTRANAAPKWVRRKAAAGANSKGARPNSAKPAMPGQLHAPLQRPRDNSGLVARAGVKRVLAHLSSRNRRKQMRRDNRG